MILIISKDEDFSSALAEQVRGELKLACREAKTVDEAKKLVADGVELAISSENITGKFPVPVMTLARQNAPFRLRQILVDIRGALTPTDDRVTLAPGFKFSLREKKLLHEASSREADLTDKEAQLVYELAKAGKNGLGKDELLKQVWGMETGVNTHTLETHIYRLRAKFRELGSEDAILASGGSYVLGMK